MYRKNILMQNAEAKLRAVLIQKDIPVVFRSGKKGEKLRAWLPYGKDNNLWLSSIGRSRPVWSVKYKAWELPKAWFNRFVENSLNRYGKLYTIQPYRIQEKCARICMNAVGHECNCSCMGANHGVGVHGGWFEVSDTFATKWNQSELACRLMIVKSD